MGTAEKFGVGASVFWNDRNTQVIELHDDLLQGQRNRKISSYQIQMRVRETRVEGDRLIVSNTDELGGGGMRQPEIELHNDLLQGRRNRKISSYQIQMRVRETRVEGNRLIISNTDELGGGGGMRQPEIE